MNRFYRWTLLGGIAACLLACGRQIAPATPTAQTDAPQVLLTHIVERYWDETAALSPWYSWGGAERRYGEAPADVLSPQAQADALAIERRYLAEVLLVPRAPLRADGKLTYDLFWRERKLAIESFTYPTELLPVNPYGDVPQRFALMASAAERYAVTGPKDFDNWQARAGSFERWTQQAIVNMREGMRRGYTLPRKAVEKSLPLLAALGADSPGNVFYPSGDSYGGDPERTRLTAALATVVKDKILPAYRSLHDFLQQEYLPRARETIGLAALPLGDAWYAYLAKRATGSTASPEEWHSLGLSEVAQLRGRLQALLAPTGFGGNAAGFIDSLRHDPRYSYNNVEELLSAYAALKAQVEAAVPALFAVAPHADFEIRRVEAFRRTTSPSLSYQRSTAYGKYPAVLYVGTADLDAHPVIDVAEFLRAAVPGHHYQIALQQERAELPRFRRFGGAPSFVAGWGLYAVSLGDELGLYHDPQTRLGAVLAQMECAAGMVVDTGIHAQKWPRQRAVDYLHAQLPIGDAAIAEKVDRIIALPGEALSCGSFLKFQALREQAQAGLGARFDLPGFHAQVLKNGALPMDLLETALKQWLEANPAPATTADVLRPRGGEAN